METTDSDLEKQLDKFIVDTKASKPLVVTGTLAKAVSPSIGEVKKDPLDDKIKSLLEDEHGAIADPHLPQQPIEKNGLSELDKKLIELSKDDPELKKKMELRVFNMKPFFFEPREGDPVLSKFLEPLNWGENVEVKGLYKAAGLLGAEKIEKPNFSDYTFENFYKDYLGMKGWGATVAGLATSLLNPLDPVNKLKFGTKATQEIGKVGEEIVALSEKGRNAFNEILKERIDKAAYKAEKKGKPISDEARNLLTEKERVKLEDEFSQKFKGMGQLDTLRELSQKSGKPISEARMKSISGDISKEVGSLPKQVFDLGGIKWGDQTIISGKEIFNSLDRFGQIPLVDKMAKTKTAERAGKSFNQLKDMLGSAFVPGYKVDYDFLKTHDAFSDWADRSAARIEKRMSQWMDTAGLKSRTDQQDFADILLKASDQVGKVSDIGSSGLPRISETFLPDRIEKAGAGEISPAVKDAIDRWVGQGKYVGKKGMGEVLKSRLGLGDDAALAVWFPGIYKGAVRPRFMAGGEKAGPATRKFLLARTGDPEKYTRDALRALSYRRTEMAFADIQDKMYQNIVEKKIGGVIDEKTFLRLNPTEQQAYSLLDKSKLVKFNKPQKEAMQRFYAPKEFVNDYEKMMNEGTPYIPILTPLTQVWKAGVTKYWPEFHARNMRSNLFLNSLSFGAKAFSPFLNRDAAAAALAKWDAKDPIERTIRYGFDLLSGKNLDKTITTETGVKLTLKQMADEAEKTGLLKKTELRTDLFGEQLSGLQGDMYSSILSQMNPLSKNFTPSQWASNFGQYVEAQGKMANYIYWRTRGLSPKAASAEAMDSLFDYSKLTRAEKWAKNIIPFYTFDRKNIGRHIQIFGKDPKKIADTVRFYRSLAPDKSQVEQMTPEQRKMFSVSIGGNIYSGIGMPIESIVAEADDPVGELLSKINPAIKYVGENITETDWWSGRKLKELNNGNEFKFIYKIARNPDIPAELKAPVAELAKFLKLEPDKKRPNKVLMDPDIRHALSVLPTSRAQSTFGRFSRDEAKSFENTVRLLTGLYKVEPNFAIANAKSKKEILDQAIDDVVGKNIGKVISVPKRGIVVFGSEDKYTNEYLQKFFDLIQSDITDSQRKEVFKKLEETTTQMRESKMKRLYK